MTETERMYAYFICSIPMIGGVRAGQLLSRFGDPQGGYEGRRESRYRRLEGDIE